MRKLYNENDQIVVLIDGEEETKTIIQVELVRAKEEYYKYRLDDGTLVNQADIIRAGDVSTIVICPSCSSENVSRFMADSNEFSCANCGEQFNIN
jgi:transposase-like protein